MLKRNHDINFLIDKKISMQHLILLQNESLQKTVSCKNRPDIERRALKLFSFIVKKA